MLMKCYEKRSAVQFVLWLSLSKLSLKPLNRSTNEMIAIMLNLTLASSMSYISLVYLVSRASKFWTTSDISLFPEAS